MNDGEDKPSTPSEDELLAELARAPELQPTSALLGTRLGRYEIESVLGRGGMGVVYRARDTVLGRHVALKLVPPEVLADAERRARFVREARSAAAATHANIAAVYDVGEIEGQVFLAMELVEGESLRARIRQGPLAVEDAVVVARGIVRGLAKAHEKGIVHRDLKPDNVMVGEAHHVKLLDFGLAKLREVTTAAPREGDKTLTYDGRVLGTPSYMSPEQAKGKEVDPRTDLFAFGVVFFEMLAGERPFRGDSAIEILSAVTRDDPPPLPAYVPKPLRAIVLRCLAKDPDQRYASAKDLLVDLEGTGSSSTSSIRAPAKSLAVPGERRRSRVPAIAVALVGGAVLVAFGASRMKEPGATTVPVATNEAGPARGRAITDHPRPPSANPAALAAYMSALQNLRDGSIAFASHELERAVTLDHELAAAHLRILLVHAYKMDATVSREHYAAAQQHRASLDARDVALLQAMEEMIRERPDHKAMARAMDAVAAKWPDDAEVVWVHANVLGIAGRKEEAKKAIHRARELDPQFAAALWFESSLFEDDDMDGAVRLLDECLRISPSAASCLRMRSGIRAARGDCAGFEADARRMTEIEPRGPRAYEYLAAALAARSAPLDSVKAALDKRASLGVPGTNDSPEEMRAQADLWVALLAGDFVAAESAAQTLERMHDGDATEGAHVMPALVLMDIYEERGEPERALGVGETFVRRLPAWTANAPSGVRAKLVALRHRLGRLDDKQAAAERAALHEEATELAHDPNPSQSMWQWLHIDAQYVTSASEAKEALARLDAIPKDAGSTTLHGFSKWPRGKVELLAGSTTDAARSLEDALASCMAMPTTDEPWARMPFANMEARILLGDALAETDRNAACDAWARVIDQWKEAKPRSVSVERARARARARGCVHS